jgi:hypothetical protein
MTTGGFASTASKSAKTRNAPSKYASLNPFLKAPAPPKNQASKTKSSRVNVAQSDEARSTKSTAKTSAGETSPTASGTASKSAKSGGYDATTLALIEAELRDATPEEREQVRKDLDGVPADMVPKILSLRRMALKYHERQETTTAQIQQAAAEAKAEPAGAGHSGVAARNAPATVAASPTAAGLGTQNPWSHNRPAAPGQPAGDASRTADYSLPPALAGTPRPGLNPAAASPSTEQPHAAYQNPGNLLAQAPAGSVPAATPVNGGPSNPVQLGQYVTPITGPAGAAAAPRVATTTAPNQPPFNPSQQSPPQQQQQQPASPLWGQLIPGKFGPRTGNAAEDPQRSNLAVASAIAERLPGAVTNAGMETSPPNPGGAVPFGQVPAAWQQNLEQLTAAAAAETAQLTLGKTDAEKQLYIEKHVYLRMLYLMSGQQERALQYIPGLDPADQEFWQQVFWGMTNYFDSNAMPNPADRATQTIAQFNAAVLRLKEKAHLELRNVSFCHKISSFGDYERYPRDEFSPGQEVLLYAELGNFHSELTADGRYRTLLRSTLEIHKPGPQGELIEQTNYPAPEDLCRNHRRDYFLSYRLVIPQKISLGPHVLKLTVEDQLSQKVVSYTLNFTVK